MNTNSNRITHEEGLFCDRCKQAVNPKTGAMIVNEVEIICRTNCWQQFNDEQSGKSKPKKQASPKPSFAA